MISPRAGSAALRWRTAFFGSKPNSAIAPVEAREQWARTHCDGALDLQDAPLGGDAAVGREAAHLAVGAQHAMAGHDDGDRVAAHRLANLTRFVRHAEALGDLAVGHGLAGRNGPRDFIGAAVELRCATEIERDVAEVDGFSREQREHAIDDLLHRRWRHLLLRAWPASRDARSRG